MADVEYIGPFQDYKVVINGRQVPYLHGRPIDGGKISLTLDERFGLVLTVAEAEKVVPFIADAIAIGMGYSCHPSADQEVTPMPPFPRMTEITGFSTDAATQSEEGE